MTTPTKSVYLAGERYVLSIRDGMVQVDVGGRHIPALSFPDLLASRKQWAALADWGKIVDGVTRELQARKWA